jgi:hypothetical protein
MRIEIVRSVMISGEPVQAGSFAEVTLAEANLLVGLGKACFALEEEPAVEPEPQPEPPKRGRKPAQPTPAEED